MIPPNKINILEIKDLGESLEGGQGYVYKGRYVSSSGSIAIACKEFKEVSVYNQERLIHSSLNHPNILKLLGFVEYNADHGPFRALVYVWATKGTLQDYLDLNTGPQRTQETCAQYAIDFTRGVYYLHSIKILHGDLKPENTLILDDGTLVINDFGWSRKIQPNSSVTCDESFGTEDYWAPEVFVTNELTLAYDIYTLAWILYLLTTIRGTDPYGNHDDGFEKDDRARLHRINTRPAIPATASYALSMIILAGMSGNPADRPSAIQVLHVVEQKNVVFQPTTPEQIVPEQIVPEQIVPEQVVPEQVVPERVVPEQVAPQQVVPQQVTPQQVAPQQPAPSLSRDFRRSCKIL